jgi:threonine/homoserine/homoserine lactone efflux protein
VPQGLIIRVPSIVMPTTQALIGFAVVSAGLIVMPGPSSLFILAHGVEHGSRAAVQAVIGIETAAAIRVVLTAAGLSAVLASSALAFGIVRWAGVAYLIYVGIGALRSQEEALHTEKLSDMAKWRSYRKGLLVGLGNPKMAIFFIAFFPQFIDPDQGSAVVQMLVLGAIFCVLGFGWDLACACASGAIGTWLRRQPRVQAVQSRVEGITYLSLAGWAAVAGDRSRH